MPTIPTAPSSATVHKSRSHKSAVARHNPTLGGTWMRRMGVVTAGAGLGVLGLAASASAHVTVIGDSGVTQGGWGVITFRVPTESATASTTEVRVAFPSTTPISFASVQPVAGWTAKVTTKKLATPVKTDDGTLDTYVSEVDWKATSPASAIKPGQFQMFNISAGPMPKAASVSFPATQVYSDGKVVRWNEISQGGAEPDHPAPTLTLASDAASAHEETEAKASSTTPSWPGYAGLAAGILGLIAGVAALGRSRSRAS